MGFASHFRAFALFGAMASGGCAQAADKGPKVENAWVRLAAVPGRPAAGYLTLRGGAGAAKVVSVSSSKAARIELHESMNHGGMMMMHPVTALDVPANTAVRLQPGGKHLMIFGLVQEVKAGADVPISLLLDGGTVIRAHARAIAAGDDAPAAK